MFRRKPPEPTLPPEWLIVGLGNPGPEYAGTRHNVGFMLIELLAERMGIKIKHSKHRALFGVGTLSGTSVQLAKPLTYMNLSGQSVAPMMRDLRLKPDRVLALADDLDLPLGRLRLRLEGSSGGHNGHKSLEQLLGTRAYPRLKIGIGRAGAGPGNSTIDHVLSKFHPEERVTVDAALRRAADGIELLLQEGPERAMAFLNPGTTD